MEELLKALWPHLIARGKKEDGRKIYHFLLKHGVVLEIVV